MVLIVGVMCGLTVVLLTFKSIIWDEWWFPLTLDSKIWTLGLYRGGQWFQ